MNKNYKSPLPLHTKVHITFKDKSTEDLYTNKLDWDVVGTIWQVDEEHIWIKKESLAIVRYPINWINIEFLESIVDHWVGEVKVKKIKRYTFDKYCYCDMCGIYEEGSQHVYRAHKNEDKYIKEEDHDNEVQILQGRINELEEALNEAVGGIEVIGHEKLKDRLSYLDVVHNKDTLYKYKGEKVKVIGSLLGSFELNILRNPKQCFEEIEEFLCSAKVIKE